MNFQLDYDRAISLEQRITGLQNLALQIENAKGMSKSFALEAITHLPTFSIGVSSAYFTTEPTFARYHVSLEEIEAGVWALIAAGVAALLAIVYKAIKYFFPDFMGGKDKDSSSSGIEAKTEKLTENVKGLEEQSNQYVTINSALSSTQATPDSKKKGDSGSRNVDDLVKNIINDSSSESHLIKMLTVQDPLVADIIFEGPYFGVMKKSESILEGMFKTFDKLAKDFELAAIIMSDLENNKEVTAARFEYFSKMEATYAEQSISTEKLTLAGFSSYVNGIRTGVSEQKHAKTVEFTKYQELATRSIKSSNAFVLLHKVEAFGKKVNDVKDDIDHANKGMLAYSKTDKPSAEAGTAFGHFLKIAQQEVHGALMMCSQVDKYATTLNGVCEHMQAMLLTVCRLADEALVARDAPKPVIAEVKEIKGFWANFHAARKA